MDVRLLIVVAVTLVLAAAFLFMWMRRDRGEEPVDHLPDALHEPLDGIKHAPQGSTSLF